MNEHGEVQCSMCCAWMTPRTQAELDVCWRCLRALMLLEPRR